ncbi:MAG: acetylxylan esterase [Verrucomicrobiales bacterium]|nr:acetylxylan esterase [Verrucomicrobiales bacterium]
MRRATIVLHLLIVSLFALSTSAQTGSGSESGRSPRGPRSFSTNQIAEMQARIKLQRDLSEKDWQKMADQLKLPPLPVLPSAMEDTNRPPDLRQRPVSNSWYDELGNTCVRSPWGNWTNYKEEKAGNYALPDPLVLKSGRPVKDADTWWTKRRPEILNDFETYIYGKTPTKTPRVTFEVSLTETNTSNGTIKKNIIGLVDNSAYPSARPSVNVTLYLPGHAVGPVPVIVVAAGGFPGFPGGRPARFGSPSSPQEQVLAKGWAYATVATGPIQGDSGSGFAEGIIGLVNKGQPRKPDDWGVLAAWSWGLSRALDYLETDKAIDAKKAAIQGHSRWGKAALLAAALDQRWSLVFPSCSGSMGASLEKRNYGETIDIVAGVNEYHWMAGNFLRFGGHWENMPVDAHELIALIAPRPVFVTGGTRDQSADPRGEFLACVAASPVYQLLGKKGVGATEMPAADLALTNGDIAFRNHEGGHSDAPDWPVFLEFAEKYFQKTQPIKR